MAQKQTFPLEVQLKHARDLREVDRFGKNDAYALLNWGSTQKHRSLTHQNGGKDPVWNQTFTFNDVGLDAPPLRLELFDENKLLKDKLIGDCKVNLAKVFDDGTLDIDVPVISKGHAQGTVSLTLTLKGYDPSKVVEVATPLPKASPKGAKPTGSKPSFGLMPAASGYAPSKFILPQYANRNCWDFYDKGKLLGKGNFGKTYLATHKTKGTEFAVKVINKRLLSTLEAIQDVRNEVEVLHHLAGHPNVVNLEQVYEDNNDICLVLELMRGGDLFEAISKKMEGDGFYTEKDAAALARDIVSVVAKCHAESVIHRDIKPHNFLLTSNGPDAKLKAADFGFSCFFQEGSVLHDPVGTLYYMAPEVIKRSYGKEADIWSCGVILYMLLSGRYPFGADATSMDLLEQSVLMDNLDMESPPMDSISDEAKDCVKRMLRRDPKHRAKAQDILNHDWLRENGCASDNHIEVGVVSRILKFNQGNKLKKAVTQFMVSKLPLDEIKGLRSIFRSIDVSNTGRVTLKQFADAIKQMGTKLPEADLRALWNDIDHDGDGTLLYEEFLAATIHQSKLEREDRVKAAFMQYDLDGDGFITPEELRKGLKDEGISAQDIEEIIRQIDQDGDGIIDYNEFVVMMRNRDD